jgi:Cu/Zn superoxide dismutase
LALAGAALLVVGGRPVAAQSQSAGATYRAALQNLPNTRGSGEATLTLRGQTLTVRIVASGLDAGGAHLSHIHGLSSGSRAVESRCPTSAQDSDSDGFVELAEGATTYGPILVDFMNIDPDQDGNIDFTTTVELSGQAAARPLSKRHIVIHGQTVGAVGAGTPGEVNGTPGYKVLLPVLCGEITNAPNNNALEFRTRK